MKKTIFENKQGDKVELTLEPSKITAVYNGEAAVIDLKKSDQAKPTDQDQEKGAAK